jgi:uncharacterized protein
MRFAVALSRLGVLPAVLVCTSCVSSPPAEKPALVLTGRVVDEAGLLTPEQERLIVAKLAALETHQGAQFVVATTRSLQGKDINDYSITLARAWGLGSKKHNDGLLLLVAPNERRLRIEVGKGLEKKLPDELCAKIIRQDITPRFKSGAMFDGINAGVDALLTAIELPAAPEKAKAA